MLRHLRRIVIAVVGGLVVAVGVAMLVLPGPAVIVIPAGLAILATEFPWAQRLLHRVRQKLESGLSRFRRRRGPTSQSSPPQAPPSSGPSDRGMPTSRTRSSDLRAS
jgi:uncharacterized protein (TIGR02611 family)